MIWSTAIFLIALYHRVNFSKGEDELLPGKVERWIWYSIHEEAENTYRNPQNGNNADDPCPPKAELANLTKDKNSALGQFSVRTNLDGRSRGNNQKLRAKTLKAIENCQWLMKEDMERWGKGPDPRREPGDIGHSNADQWPRWMRTVARISNAIAWEHFDAFIFIIKECTNNRIIRGRQRNSAAGDILLMLDRMRPACTRAHVDLSLLQASLKSLADEGKDGGALQKAIAAGALACASLLHIVLYQVLLDTLVKDRGGDAWTPNFFIRIFTGSPTWHSNMPRRAYLEYWLNEMVSELKHEYEELRDKFVESVEKPIRKEEEAEREEERERQERENILRQHRQAGTQPPAEIHRPPRVKMDWRVRLVLRELAKYAQYWDRVLVVTKKLGVQALDMDIDLLGDDERRRRDAAQQSASSAASASSAN